MALMLTQDVEPIAWNGDSIEIARGGRNTEHGTLGWEPLRLWSTSSKGLKGMVCWKGISVV